MRLWPFKGASGKRISKLRDDDDIFQTEFLPDGTEVVVLRPDVYKASLEAGAKVLKKLPNPPLPDDISYGRNRQHRPSFSREDRVERISKLWDDGDIFQTEFLPDGTEVVVPRPDVHKACLGAGAKVLKKSPNPPLPDGISHGR